MPEIVTATKPPASERTSKGSATNTPERRGLKSGITNFSERFGLAGLLLIMVLIFGVFAPTSALFSSGANIQNILANQSVTGLVALSMVITLVAGYLDLSAAAIAGVSSVAMGAMLVYGLPIPLAILVALLIALACGVLNAVLVAVLELDPFIVTLGTYVLFNGLLLAYTQGRVLGGFPSELGMWGAGQWFGIARPFWLLLIAAAIIWYTLSQTPYGRKLEAIGSNAEAASLAGIRVNRHVFIAYILGALIAGCAGVLLSIRTGSADAASGASFIFPAIAAVFLGQTTVKPGYPNVVGTIIGVFFVAVAVNGFTLLGAQNWISEVFNGAALVLAVAMATIMTRVRNRNARKQQMRDMEQSAARTPASSRD